MGFRDRSRKSKKAELYTYLISPGEGGGWEALWIGEEHPYESWDCRAPNLDELVARAASEIASLALEEGAELQFAIYPWENGDVIDVVLHVSQSAGMLIAKDDQGSTLSVSGATLEELIVNAEKVLANPSRAMLQWALRVEDGNPGT